MKSEVDRKKDFPSEIFQYRKKKREDKRMVAKKKSLRRNFEKTSGELRINSKMVAFHEGGRGKGIDH